MTTPPVSDTPETVRTFDAQTWAKSFNETLVKLGYQPHDEGWLISWFANSIMCGYDHALALREKREEWVMVPREPTEEMLRAGHKHVAEEIRLSGGRHDHGVPRELWYAMLAAAREGEKP